MGFGFLDRVRLNRARVRVRFRLNRAKVKVGISLNIKMCLRWLGIEPWSTAWKGAMVTTTPPSLQVINLGLGLGLS